MGDRLAIGMCFDRTFPAAEVTTFARRLEAGGVDQLWVIDDCFFTSGVPLAAAALGVTDRLQVGLGILPAVGRNAAVTAMEIATLCGLGPGRVLPGIGHGVQSWMGQMGERTPSPLTTLEEVIVAVTHLLRGDRVTAHGSHVHLDDVALAAPPDPVPPILAGVRGPRSLILAGRVAGGVVLAEPASPSYVRAALDLAGHPDRFHVAVFSALCMLPDRAEAHRTMAPWLAGILRDPTAGLRALPFFEDLMVRFDDHGVDGLATMPADWWREIGPIGTIDDAAEHLAALAAAGVHSIGLFPAPEFDVAVSQLDDVVELATTFR